jgi:CubicO group peptidase (beta-lactamase class C family)
LRGDRIVAQGVAGVRKRGANEPITINDQFEICSCSKAMTATLTALLIEEGKLRWDTTLEELFRDAVPSINPAWKSVTVRQALAHSAGMRDHLVRFALATTFTHDDVPTQRRKFAARVLSRRPDFPPGSESRYNSTDFVVLAAGLEWLTGQSWEELIRERFFNPLKLCSAGFGPPGTPGQLDQPWGHGNRWWFHWPCFGPGCTPLDPGSRFADVPAAAAPAGLVHLSVLDWAKFVTVHLRGDTANPNHAATLLKEDSFATLHHPGPNETYAGGWFIGTRKWAKGPRPDDSGRVLFHQGDNGRWNSVVWVAPEIDFAMLSAIAAQCGDRLTRSLAPW